MKQDKQYLYETICMTANTVVNQKVFHFFKDKQYVCLVSIPCPIITVFILQNDKLTQQKHESFHNTCVAIFTVVAGAGVGAVVGVACVV